MALKNKIITASFLLSLFLNSRALFADETISDPRLDRVLENQAQILKELAEIKSELAIVKVRATDR
jgi:hypothetical protein